MSDESIGDIARVNFDYAIEKLTAAVNYGHPLDAIAAHQLGRIEINASPRGAVVIMGLELFLALVRSPTAEVVRLIKVDPDGTQHLSSRVAAVRITTTRRIHERTINVETLEVRTQYYGGGF